MSMTKHPPVRSLILAAGFATRMKGIDTPKGLINIDGGSSMDRMLADFNAIPLVGKTAVIANSKSFPYYKNWLKFPNASRGQNKIKLLNNGVSNKDDKKGAIGDLIHALDILGWWNQDLLVMPCDTLYRGTLATFIDFYQMTLSRPGLATIVYEHPKELIAGRLGCVEIEGNKITRFTEKPEAPFSSLAIAPFYFYPQQVLNLLKQYVNEGGDKDAPSSIISWLLDRKLPVYAYKTKPSFDLGYPADINTARLYLQLETRLIS